ncbi:MAG: putative ArsR family transcriptional regulator [Myxococcota bacterium]|jgi:predicted ArsR family transcriptional regulator
MSEPRTTILSALRQHGSLTIDALMDRLTLSKTATRAHLTRLERDGLVTRVSPKISGPGRPPVSFRLTNDGGARFPTLDSELLERLLTFLGTAGRNDLIVQFFQSVWSERRSALLNDLETDDFSAVDLPRRLRALERLLAESRFMPQIETTATPASTRVLVRECNCPLPAAVRATRIPCRLESEFLREVIGGESLAVSLASDRADTCSFEFLVEGEEFAETTLRPPR